MGRKDKTQHVHSEEYNEERMVIRRGREQKWAHKLATISADTWTTVALHWDLTANTQPRAHRAIRRPKTR